MIYNTNRDIHTFLIINQNFHKPLFSFPSFSSKKTEHVAIWNSASSSLVCGSILKTLNKVTLIIQHWILSNPRNKNSNILIRCMGCSLYNRFIDNNTTMKIQLKKFICVSFQENDLMIKLNKSTTYEGYKPRGSFVIHFISIDIHNHILHRYQLF